MSLESFRDYCRERADDPEIEERDRELWIQIADEIDEHLAPSSDPVDDYADADALFGIDGAP
jgi:hypothetical protein